MKLSDSSDVPIGNINKRHFELISCCNMKGSQLYLSFTDRLLELGHLEEDCSITTISENKRFSSFSCKVTNKIQDSTMWTLKTLKAFDLTWLLRKQLSNSWMLWVRLQKNLRIFCFQKSLWLDMSEISFQFFRGQLTFNELVPFGWWL